MTLERSSVCFWRLLSWFMLFGALWLFQIPSGFGYYGSISALIVFLIGSGFLIYKDTSAFRFPSKREIDRRIEKDSNVKNRPLSGIQDKLVNDEKREARQLWARSRMKLLGLLPRLQPAKLRGFLAERDPYAIRLGVLMAFVLGLLAAGPEWSLRIRHGLTPFSVDLQQTEKADRFTIIITAPEYTSLPQMILNDKTIQGEMLSIAEGSKVKALINGGWGKKRLYFDEAEHVFEDAVELEIPDINGDLRLRQGLKTLAQWPYEIIPDAPPEISFLKDKPEVLSDGGVSFSLSVKDDYGVQYLDAYLDLAKDVPSVPMGKPVVIRRSVVSPDGEDFELTPLYDFTSHPWAGLPAAITFTAVDEKGQDTSLPPIEFPLPERHFKHPIAKTLVTLRKKLSWNPLDKNTYNETSYDMHVLSSATELMHNDIVVYLAIRTAALRLNYNEPSIETTQAVMDLMWDTALRVEDGDLSLAARRLRDAQMALEDALQNPDITEEEIASLMQDLREAMAEYFNELAREAQKRMADGQMPMMDPSMMNRMNQSALSEFLEQMEQAMRDGDMDSAQEMLSQMQRLMDMLNPSMSAQMPPDMKMMEEGINELQELIERQEALMEQTQKQADLMATLEELGLNNPMNRAPNEDQAAPPFVNTEANQTEQEALRYILGQLMLEANEVIGEIPDAMGLAEQEMRDSGEKLGLNWPNESIPHQEQAIEYLKQSQEELAQQLQQRMVQMTGFMLSFGQRQMRHDPLGRPMGGEDGSNGDPFGSRVKVPDEAEQHRVQEILKLLRQRAGQYGRPREELEYYRRLLKRF